MENVTSFIDSETLSFMLKDKVLPPAVECILISRSTCRPLRDKIAAIRERLDKYTDEELAVGDYEWDSENFRKFTEQYIQSCEYALSLIESEHEEAYYIAEDEFTECGSSVFDDWERALKWILTNDELCGYDCIIRRIRNEKSGGFRYYFNSKKEIYKTENRDSETDWSDKIESAFVELPHDYKIGNIICYYGNHYVIAKLSPYVKKERRIRLDNTDMALFCFGYYNNNIHSCGGTYGHCHIPILDAELADIKSLTYSEKPLLELRKVLIGERNFVDFLEMYSNNYLTSFRI